MIGRKLRIEQRSLAHLEKRSIDLEEIVTKLIDLGEKQIVHGVIYEVFPHLQNLHDDAICLPVMRDSSIVLSCDPCPEPIVCQFDYQNRYYHYGWMSVLINYSDLAAEGAEPLGVLLSTIMPESMEVDDYRQFLCGVRDACLAWGGDLLGGNIKDGPSFSVTGTAIGKKQKNKQRMTRTGINENDCICVVGEMGMFWLAVIQLLGGTKFEELNEDVKKYLVAPFPKIKEGLILADSGYPVTCMDSSDGIIGCLYELAELNHVSILVEDSLLQPNDQLKKYCELSGIDYRNYMLAFGGWELVFSCRQEDVQHLQCLFRKNNTNFKVIGRASCYEPGAVFLCQDEKLYRINNFSSTRFAPESMFTHGLAPCINRLHENQFSIIQGG